MQGLGDNIYQRAVLRALGPVYLRTPWPQLYGDMPVQCVDPKTELRTQKKNASRGGYVPAPSLRPLTLHYRPDNLSILESLARSVGVPTAGLYMDLPDFGPGPLRGRYIVVRPSTYRKEWPAESRNPKPQYLADAAAIAREAGFRVVSVADLQAGHEWADTPLPPADVVFHQGELNVEALMALVANAAGVIGGVGWVAPACLAYRTPLFLIYGGWGKSNGPNRIFGPLVDSSNIEQVLPDAFCKCDIRDHGCDKRISRLAERARSWVESLGPPLGRATPLAA